MIEAYFAAGCFWGIQYKFDNIKKGIIKTVVGYSGFPRLSKKPTYAEICSGKTGYSETIRIRYNNKLIKYEDLCTFFFSIHDFAKLNKPQYKSAIFYVNNYQKNIATSIKKKISKNYNVKTEILEFKNFYKAEEYHQKYYQKKIN